MLKDSAMTSQTAREALIEELLSAWPYGEDIAGVGEHYICAAILPLIARIEAERDEMRAALDGIDVYGSDTLSGRVKPDPATYKAWLIEGIIEMRNRARAALGAKP